MEVQLTSKIFVDFSVLDDNKTVSLIRSLSDSYEIIVFSCDKEENRLTYEEKLIFLELGADELLLRADGDFTRTVDLIHFFVLDKFDGHDERAVNGTLTIYCNNERAVERLREEGFHCSMTGWE